MKVFCIIYFFYTNVTAQEEFLPEFRNNVKPVELYFQNILENNNYIIYCSKNKLLLYFIWKNNYYEIIFEGTQDREKAIKGSNEVNYNLISITLMNNDLMDDIFIKEKYTEGYSDSLIIDSTKGLISLDGLPTYFVYKENVRKTYSEYILSIFMKPVPMDLNLYKFFTSRMVNN